MVLLALLSMVGLFLAGGLSLAALFQRESAGLWGDCLAIFSIALLAISCKVTIIPDSFGSPQSLLDAVHLLPARY